MSERNKANKSIKSYHIKIGQFFLFILQRGHSLITWIAEGLSQMTIFLQKSYHHEGGEGQNTQNFDHVVYG